MANILAIEKKIAVVSALAEGASIRGIERITNGEVQNNADNLLVINDTILAAGILLIDGTKRNILTDIISNTGVFLLQSN